jgi:DNA polymerase-3 subunit alpha
VRGSRVEGVSGLGSSGADVDGTLNGAPGGWVTFFARAARGIISDPGWGRMADFVHLHVHSDYSLLDGLSKVESLAQGAVDMGMPALALTDHGAVIGALHFYDAAKKAGIRPILGCEMYVAPRRMDQKEPQVDTRPYHVVLLAENDTGYHNLMQLATAAQLEGFYYKPRVDRAYLAAHSAGLIALSSCGSGEVPRLLQEGRPDSARQAAEWYREVFGPQGFFLELQEHEIPEMGPVNPALVELGRATGIPLVATNDAHYLRRDQAHAHEVLLCIGTGKTMTDPSRMRMNNDSYYLRSPREMEALFGDLPDALRNTVAIARSSWAFPAITFRSWTCPRALHPTLTCAA